MKCRLCIQGISQDDSDNHYRFTPSGQPTSDQSNCHGHTRLKIDSIVHKNRTSPLMAVVSKVPTELLTEIFHLLCKRFIFVCELNNSRCKEDFPWAVGLVCRQWRTAFLSYPPIWASLTLSDRHYDSSEIVTKARSESYAKEINRRLALYLERSGAYPLRLDICLWLDHTMTLEMLLACSHRWRTARFNLSHEWQVDSIFPCKGKLPTLERLEISVPLRRKHAWDIFEVAPRLTHAYAGPWAQNYGWILPWTQLTELILTLDGSSVIENRDIPNLLPMLHNIKELRFRFDDHFDDGFPEFPPAPLNQLRVLEVPHPVILMWFEAPSLCELYFADHEELYVNVDEPLDVHMHVSSLIQRSGCRIRKLSFQSGRKFYVGTLKDVEELVIDYTRSWIDSSIDISSLPNLRLLTIICRKDQSKSNSLITALKSARVPIRSGCSSSTPVSLLECVTVELQYAREEPKIPKRLLEIADKWPVVVFRTQRDPYFASS